MSRRKSPKAKPVATSSLPSTPAIPKQLRSVYIDNAPNFVRRLVAAADLAAAGGSSQQAVVELYLWQIQRSLTGRLSVVNVEPMPLDFTQSAQRDQATGLLETVQNFPSLYEQIASLLLANLPAGYEARLKLYGRRPFVLVNKVSPNPKHLAI